MSATTHQLSIKPYVLRAFYEWCHDNGYTPYLVVFVDEEVDVPDQYVHEQKITLNISAASCKNLLIDNQWISASTRFAGISHDIQVPIGHVLSIFAKETGQAMDFALEATQATPVVHKPTLTTIKGDAPLPKATVPNDDGKKPTGHTPSGLHIIKGKARDGRWKKT